MHVQTICGQGGCSGSSPWRRSNGSDRWIGVGGKPSAGLSMRQQDWPVGSPGPGIVGGMSLLLAVRRCTSSFWCAVLPALVVTTVLLTSCGSSGGPSFTQVATARTPVVTPSSSPSSEPAPSAPAPGSFARRVDAGTIQPSTTPLSVSGDGPTEVRYVIDEEAAVVVTLDCSACAGGVILTEYGRTTPYAAGEAPYRATALAAVMPQDDHHVLVDAEGPWTLELVNWNYMPIVDGTQTGTGPSVVFFGSTATQLEITVSDIAADDTVALRVFADESAAGGPMLHGWDGPGTETRDVNLPGVAAIRTNGSWTMTPRA